MMVLAHDRSGNVTRTVEHSPSVIALGFCRSYYLISTPKCSSYIKFNIDGNESTMNHNKVSS